MIYLKYYIKLLCEIMAKLSITEKINSFVVHIYHKFNDSMGNLCTIVLGFRKFINTKFTCRMTSHYKLQGNYKIYMILQCTKQKYIINYFTYTSVKIQIFTNNWNLLCTKHNHECGELHCYSIRYVPHKNSINS